MGLSHKGICKLIQMPSSSYYYKQKHRLDKITKDGSILKIIKEVFESKKCKAWIRTVSMILQSRYGITVNLKKIARIKRQYGLVTQIRKKNPYNIAFKKGLEHRIAPNLLQQNFEVTQPDKVYSTDISYLIYTGGRRAYLMATKDLATRELDI